MIDESLVPRGPFRFVPHPSYIIVGAEIFVAPMVLGLIWVALDFSLANDGMLAIPMRAEDAAPRRPAAASDSAFGNHR